MFHTNYWEFSDTNVTPVAVVKPGYPAWQSSVIAPSGLGMIGAWLDTWLERWRWWKRFAPRVHRLNPERRAVLMRTLDLLESPAYGSARIAVRETSKILGFNKPDAWTHLKRELKDSPGQSENVMRHLEAMRRVRLIYGSTLTNPTAHLVTELAYDGFTRFPKVP